MRGHSWVKMKTNDCIDSFKQTAQKMPLVKIFYHFYRLKTFEGQIRNKYLPTTDQMKKNAFIHHALHFSSAYLTVAHLIEVFISHIHLEGVHSYMDRTNKSANHNMKQRSPSIFTFIMLSDSYDWMVKIPEWTLNNKLMHQAQTRPDQTWWT